MRKYLIIIFLVFITIALGFFRDSVFGSINEGIKNGSDAGITKWILTIAFTISYLIITLLFLWILYKSIKYVIIGIGIYTCIFLVSLLISLFGYIFFSFNLVYPFVRTIMGVAQSPIITMVLIAIFYINKK